MTRADVARKLADAGLPATDSIVDAVMALGRATFSGANEDDLHILAASVEGEFHRAAGQVQ